MVWACFGKNGLGPLVVVEGTVNATKYKALLEHNVVPLMENWFPDGDGIFQQDNAPCHKARMIKEFLANCDFELLEWPPYSPDLSPIENLWAIIKMDLKKMNFSSKKELTTKIKEIWDNNERLRNHCLTLINSMPRRIEAVIKAKGGPIKY